MRLQSISVSAVTTIAHSADERLAIPTILSDYTMSWGKPECTGRVCAYIWATKIKLFPTGVKIDDMRDKLRTEKALD